jgi:hypothetical protein
MHVVGSKVALPFRRFMPTIAHPGPSPDALTCPGPRTINIELDAPTTDVDWLESILLTTHEQESVRFCYNPESKQPEDLQSLIRSARKFGRIVELW